MDRITIVTRTNNRPKGFKRLRESIEAQTYPNIHHLVIVDNKQSLKYVKKYKGDNVSIITVDLEELKQLPRDPQPEGCEFFPFNLYFNEAYKHIDGGYIWLIDDDDEIEYDDTVERIMRKAGDGSNVIFGQMRFGDRVLPSHSFGKVPTLYDIGGSCVVFPSSMTDVAKWDTWKCGDYRVCKRLHDAAKNVIWMEEVIMRCNIVGGNGKREDIC